jgi:hypothetical protein
MPVMEYWYGAETLNCVSNPVQAQFFAQNTKSLDSAEPPPIDRAGKPFVSFTLKKFQLGAHVPTAGMNTDATPAAPATARYCRRVMV